MPAALRAVWDAILDDDLDTKGASLLAGLAVVVPGGSLLLILRWPPLRRAVRSLLDGTPPAAPGRVPRSA